MHWVPHMLAMVVAPVLSCCAFCIVENEKVESQKHAATWPVAVTAGGGSVSDERVAVLISSVELLRGQIRCDHHKTPK